MFYYFKWNVETLSPYRSLYIPLYFIAILPIIPTYLKNPNRHSYDFCFSHQTHFKELKRRRIVYSSHHFCCSFFIPDVPSFHLV